MSHPHGAPWRICLAALSLSFGVVCILPHIWQRLDPLYPFQGIEMMGTDQEYYASRIREVMDGHMLLGDVYYADLKDRPFVQPPLPEWVQGGIGLALGLDAARTMVVAKFLFGTLLFLFLALACTRLFQKPWLSLLAASAVLFSWFLFASPWVFLAAVKGLPLGGSVARFSRLTNPQFSLTLFFIALWAFLGLREHGRTRDLLLAGVAAGLSFSSYFYTWTYLLSTFGFLFLRGALRREWKAVRMMTLLGGITLLVASPYLLFLPRILGHPDYPDLAARIGMVASRTPLLGYWVTLFLLLALAFGRRVSRCPEVLLALAIAGVVVLNQQVLTGRALVPHHYHWYYIHPLAIVIIVVLAGATLATAIKGMTRARALLFATVLGFFLLMGTKFQADAYAAQRQAWGVQQRSAGVLSFLNLAGFRSLSVYAPDALREIITVYTPLDVTYAVNTSNCCLTPTSRLRDVYFFELWLQSLSPRDAERQFFGERRNEVSRRLYGIYYRERTGVYEGIPDDAVREAVNAYRAYSALSLCSRLARQPLDLVAWPADRPLTPQVQELIDRGTIVYQDDAYRVWDVRGVCSERLSVVENHQLMH